MIDCSKPKFRRLDDENLTVRADKGQLDSVVESKLLGIKLNKCLTWENHVAYVKGKIGEQLDLLKRTQKFLSVKTRTLFYNLIIQLILSLIHSRWGEALRDDTKNGCEQTSQYLTMGRLSGDPMTNSTSKVLSNCRKDAPE